MTPRVKEPYDAMLARVLGQGRLKRVPIGGGHYGLLSVPPSRLRRAVLPFMANAALVALVAFQTWTVSHDQLARAVFVQFAVGGAWAFNVRSLSTGGWPERLGYMAGGSVGVALGILAARGLR